ncbi:MAG: holo-ACP synthase, partial [Paraclostridium sp.]
MNILDIGIDIVEIDRIQEAVNKNKRFLEKLFTEKEIKYFESKNFRIETIAGNFAAKEAISKAI